MSAFRALLLAFTCLGPAGSELAAQCVIEGRVPIASPAAPRPTARYALKSGAVASAPPPVAVVYLEGAFRLAPPAKPVVLVQKGYQFERSILAVQTGTRIEFPNEDEDYHNVFSYSKAKRFDLGRYRRDETPPALVFDKPGVVRLYCEIHEHMRGVILVLDTPHFASTAPDGKFRLSGLPEGNFVLKAWLDEKTVLQRPVALKSGALVRVDFAASVAAR